MGTTAKDLRKKYIKTAAKYIGAVQGSKKHRELVDVFNSVRPDGELMTYTAPWCAASTTAWAILALGKKDAAKAIPLDYNCGRLIEKAKRKGEWIEDDNHKPTAGDLIIFNWTGGPGQIKIGADHVGVVEKVSGGYIHTIEGNYTRAAVVGRRTFPLGWEYIRGFISPKYEAIATQPTKETTEPQKPAKTKKNVPAGTYYRVNSLTGLNVRKGPGVGYKIITAIPDGTRVRITKSKQGWSYSPDLGGWMFAAYIRKEK